MATSAEDSLFPASLIPTSAASELPPSFTIRPLRRSDYARGYLDCLRVLTWVGDLTEDEFSERFDEMAAAKGVYYLLVIEHEGRIVGNGSLIVEKKFIHNRGQIGHIEEIAISEDYQGRGLGRHLLAALDVLARDGLGCYKNILDCGPRSQAFYTKCGYVAAGTEMVQYFDKLGETKGDYYRG
ncbi:hypothetical protein VTK73DRAFT_7196 [Phialemonium thermophilum]|uniref:Glucosamine 6-phosphate N-acetyltransferase n=1 Tax=Phialemonium thermophilum TaxID=223376 RepID=A0ABR3WG93_9PEZI